MGQVIDGVDPQGKHLLFRGAAYKKQGPDRERPQLLGNLMIPQGMAQIWLFKIRGHLCQKLVGGNAYIHCKSQLFFHPSSYLIRHLIRLPEKMDGAGHVQKCLVDAELLHIRRIFFQKADELFGKIQVHIKAGGHRHKRGALFQCLGHRLSGDNAISPGGSGFGQHHPVSGFLIASYNGRDGPQV